LTRKRSKVKKHCCGKKRKIDGTIITEYQQLLAALQKSEETLLDKNQEEIKGLIIDEIIKRYQYQEGFINIL
jgi:carboxyl-terminal processing protease